jgi:hypothetical protein
MRRVYAEGRRVNMQNIKSLRPLRISFAAFAVNGFFVDWQQHKLLKVQSTEILSQPIRDRDYLSNNGLYTLNSENGRLCPPVLIIFRTCCVFGTP